MQTEWKHIGTKPDGRKIWQRGNRTRVLLPENSPDSVRHDWPPPNLRKQRKIEVRMLWVRGEYGRTVPKYRVRYQDENRFLQDRWFDTREEGEEFRDELLKGKEI